MELKKQKKNKNQETDGYETDKRPRTEKLKQKEITLTEKLEKKLKQKKAVMQATKYVQTTKEATKAS